MAFLPSRSQPKVKLDPTPSGGEEWDDWLVEEKLNPTWDPDKARTRIDAIARWLAMSWSAFLAYLIIAQGNADGVTITLPLLGWPVKIIPHFHLQPSEFIAVVTTTTASVFGFLVIVARYLFKAGELDRSE